MKKLFSSFVALLATTALWAGNTITYTASSKLSETTDTWSEGLHTNAFNVSISSHTFSNGTGSITFSGEVTTIGYGAFWGCSSLTSITIPNSVTTIGSSAFYYCEDLTKTNYTGTIADWCKIQFSGSSSNPMYYSKNFFINDVEVKDLVIPQGVDTIENYAFSYCRGLTSVTIPNSVTTIGKSAFYNCSGLTSVKIPNSVTKIGHPAFYNVNNIVYNGTATWESDDEYWGAKCVNGYVDGYLVYSDATKTKLCGCSSAAAGEIVIPNSVTTIGNYAFCSCKLTSITIPNSVTTIGNDAFSGCNSLPVIDNIRYADTYLIEAVDETLSTYTIREGTKWIGNYAFYNCSGLTSVTIPNSVTTIGEGAFFYCSDFLTSVTIPNSVTSIGTNAFAWCSGLTSVTIPNSVTKIGNGAFWGCSSLTSVTINSNAICSETYTSFNNIFGEQVKEYIIGDSVTTIGSGAFSGCSGLTSVTIPNSVITIGDGAFSGCNSLPVIDNIRYADNYLVEAVDKTLSTYIIKEGIKWIGGHAFEGCGGLTSITIPNSVTAIGNSAFEDCRGLTSVTIPNSVTTIGSYAFYECIKLTSITIPNSVTTIGEDAFYYCSGLTKTNYTGTIADWCKIKFGSKTSNPMRYSHNLYINDVEVKDLVIPQGVDTIENYAFSYCRGLTSVTSYATTPPICGSDCFYNVSKTIPVYVPAHSIDAYKQANEWRDFTNIQTIKQGQCGTNLYWQYSDGILVISGTGAMYDYTQGAAPWILFQDSISSLVINNGCTSIGNFAFYGLSNKNLKTIDIPNSVEQIGQYAFANCEYLKNLYLGEALEKISAKAFANDERLIYITCYAMEPPLLDESAFVNYDAYLSVPCESQADYKVSKGWKLFNKENISCIGAKETPITTDDVTVTPEDDKATLVWPADDQAAGYSIEITKDGVVFCTLHFNAQGQLTGIAFAPSRGGELRTMPAAEMTAKGWQFTVTGLTPGSKYAYTVDVINAQQQSIKQYTGEFTTTGGISTGINGLTIDNAQCTVKKMIIDNQLFIFRGDKIYNAAGALMK